MYSYYPENIFKTKKPFYIEYKTESNQEAWTLCKRIFFEDHMLSDDILSSREGHPYTLHNGIVNQNNQLENLNTKKYLEFMVDSMNLLAEVS